MSKTKAGGLGKDFLSIFEDNNFTDGKEALASVPISAIKPRANQPRQIFEKEALEALAGSISMYGVLQPIIVKEKEPLALGGDTEYEIIAGERRWHAAKMAGLMEMPAIIFDGDALKAAQVSLVENIQRENLNVVEEAMAYEKLLTQFQLTQEQLSKQMGKSRSAITNTLRLLELPDDVLTLLREGEISAGHARAILALKKDEDRSVLAKRVCARSLSVRETESAVKRMNESELEAPQEPINKEDAKRFRLLLKNLEKQTSKNLGRRVKIVNTPKRKVIEIVYSDDSDLNALLSRISGIDGESYGENAAK